MNTQNGTARVTAAECHATCVYALLYGPSVTRRDGLALWGNAMVFVSVIIGYCAPTRNNQACISKRCVAWRPWWFASDSKFDRKMITDL